MPNRLRPGPAVDATGTHLGEHRLHPAEEPRYTRIAWERVERVTSAVYLNISRDLLPEPDRTPGAPHPDPFLAERGWQVNEHGIYSRKPDPDRARQADHDLEAG